MSAWGSSISDGGGREKASDAGEKLCSKIIRASRKTRKGIASDLVRRPDDGSDYPGVGPMFSFLTRPPAAWEGQRAFFNRPGVKLVPLRAESLQLLTGLIGRVDSRFLVNRSRFF